MEVTNITFAAMLPDIMDQVSSSSFVAFDCEFTALRPDPRPEMRCSLFDTMEERYRKLTGAQVPALVSQVGLAIFQQLPEPDLQQYEVRAYNFPICPRSFASVDHRFVCQSSSLEFLTRYKFDFNRFLYEGISSLSREEEVALREDLRGGAMFRALDRNLPMQDEQVIREVCSMLAAWATVAEEGERLGPLDSGMVVPLVLHTEVRTRFPTLWSFPTEEGGVVVERVAAERRAELEAEREGEQLEEQLVSSLLGFTLLFRHLSSSGVPVVGHNCLLDLLLMFRQFEAKLPADYAAFKAELHQLFPVVFDTKHIAHELRSRVGRRWPQLERILASSNLSSLHQELAKGHGRAGAPSVVAPPGFERYEGRAAPHEAAYDALLAGGCWLGLAHLAASLGTPGTDRPLAFGEKLAALAGHRNRVNVARAALNHAHLAGADPACARPVWLHVTSLRAPLARVALAERLGRWGTVDVRRTGVRTALVAVGNHAAAREVAAALRADGELTVARYRLARHSAPARAALVAAVVAGLGLGLALIYRRAAA